MKNTANNDETVAYTLYTDSARSSAFTNSQGVKQNGTGTVQVVPIYGQVEAAQLAQAGIGDYLDNVTLQLTY